MASINFTTEVTEEEDRHKVAVVAEISSPATGNARVKAPPEQAKEWRKDLEKALQDADDRRML